MGNIRSPPPLIAPAVVTTASLVAGGWDCGTVAAAAVTVDERGGWVVGCSRRGAGEGWEGAEMIIFALSTTSSTTSSSLRFQSGQPPFRRESGGSAIVSRRSPPNSAANSNASFFISTKREGILTLYTWVNGWKGAVTRDVVIDRRNVDMKTNIDNLKNVSCTCPSDYLCRQ